MSSEVPKRVYACIAAVAGEVAHSGIAKGRRNAEQGYNFRGVDDVYNALAPLLAKHGLVIIPRFLSRESVERISAKSGKPVFYVTVEAEFVFVSVDDGSSVTARSYGEASDVGDKATNKAMSAAFKYAAFQVFCIPTEGDNDADATKAEPVLPASLQVVRIGRKVVEENGLKTPRYSVRLSDGVDYVTFDEALAQRAGELKREGAPVVIDRGGRSGFLAGIRRAS
jgi:hypothetical protein